MATNDDLPLNFLKVGKLLVNSKLLYSNLCTGKLGAGGQINTVAYLFVAQLAPLRGLGLTRRDTVALDLLVDTVDHCPGRTIGVLRPGLQQFTADHVLGNGAPNPFRNNCRADFERSPETVDSIRIIGEGRWEPTSPVEPNLVVVRTGPSSLLTRGLAHIGGFRAGCLRSNSGITVIAIRKDVKRTPRRSSSRQDLLGWPHPSRPQKTL